MSLDKPTLIIRQWNDLQDYQKQIRIDEEPDQST